MSILPNIPDLRSGPIAVFGNGVSGQGAAALLRSRGAWVNMFDQHGGPGVKTKFAESDAKTHRLVVFSPGFPPDHPWLVCARDAGAKLYGELDFASIYWPGATIAVTGTNGKSTLTQFLVHALKSIGADALAAGNVGYPLSRYFETGAGDRSTVVCEISSFQAEALQAFSPLVLFWTNISEDHLDRHGSMENYFRAKWRLVERLRRPRLIIGPSVAEMAEKLGFKLPSFAKVVSMDDVELPDSGPFSCAPQAHNYALARIYWEEESYDPKVLEAAARSFQLAPHRLERVAEKDGVEFWNDSVATNAAAAEAAISTIRRPIHWIGGGRNKGCEIDVFAKRIANRLDAAYLIGESGQEMARVLGESGVDARYSETLEQAVMEAWEKCPVNGSILLSPGFASHDQFSNYVKRGECFKQTVLSLKARSARPTVNQCVKP
ncbi:MAG: UDP-N-acetylmuramoyl-L-alanine--D-glutamate ligase [Verrucomicrobiota bacterium]